ncbi:MAG: TRAP transporter small permease [Candidatus Latescibacteria bacterium]|jgi:TRAP-type C4-dicarboxylate transport system permease small subunit|nr:TRAP transporter small permease [Candidatus Latescibacterota bacterium]
MNKKHMIIEEWIIAVMMCVMVAMVGGQVVSRYVFHTSISHTEELVRYFFVWTTFLGVSAAVYRKRHLSITGLLWIVPKRIMRWMLVSGRAGAILFMVVLIIYGLRVVILQMQTDQTTAALGFPMWIVGLSIPVCSVIIMIRLLMSAIGKREDT